MNPHIYILILNWNGKDLLKPCLDSVLSINYPNYTTLVIDNNSSDGTREMVEEDYPQAEYLQLEHNYGFAGGYNRCFDYLKELEPEYILLLNNDTEVNLKLLHSFMNATEKYGSNNIFGGKIYYHHNPDCIWYAGGKVNLKLGMISHRGIRKMNSEGYSLPIKTDYVTGCCLFTSWNVIKKLEGFDEQFNMYGEDVDLCIRAEKEGINSYYWPEAELCHHVSASIGGNLNLKKIYRKYKSLFRLWVKHYFSKSNEVHG